MSLLSTYVTVYHWIHLTGVPVFDRFACSSLLLSLLIPAAASAQSAAAISPLPPEVRWQSPAPLPKVPAGWATQVEASGFTTSPSYADTLAFLQRLAAASPLLSVQTFGTTPEGRDLIYVRASKGGPSKPVVMVQGGIHAGEIDGKDAGMMLLRDIAVGGRADLLDQVDLVFVPVLNADAHENSSALGRPIQRGPAHKGARTNAAGLDLNRDYARLESREVSAVVTLLQKFDPALYVDVHVSDGIDYQYDITYTFAGWGTYARSRQTAAWLMGTYSEDMQRALTAAGHTPGVYPSWVDEDVPSKGLRISIESPRYSTGYGDFIGVPTVLVENHTLKPYEQRVRGTYTLIEQSLRSVARDHAAIDAAKRADRAQRAAALAATWEVDPVPLETRAFPGLRYDTYLSPASGARELKWTGQKQTIPLPVFGTRVTASADIPTAWWLKPGNERIVDLLRKHAIAHEVIDKAQPRTLQAVRYAKGSERGIGLRADEQILMPAGSVRIPADQPLRLLAAALLEPQSQDSVLAMGWLDRGLPAESSLSRHLLAPMADAMMAAQPELRREFEAALAEDPQFAADPVARLQWWEKRSPYYTRSLWTYPVLREI